MKIKSEKIEFTVTAEISCTEQDTFESQREFQKNDVAAIKKYIEKKIREMEGEQKYAAKIKKITIK